MTQWQMINDSNKEQAKQDYFSMSIVNFCKKWHIGSVKAQVLFGRKTNKKDFKYQKERDEREGKEKRKYSIDKKSTKGYIAPIPKEVLEHRAKVNKIAQEETALQSRKDYWKEEAGIIYNTYF